MAGSPPYRIIRALCPPVQAQSYPRFYRNRGCGGKGNLFSGAGEEPGRYFSTRTPFQKATRSLT